MTLLYWIFIAHTGIWAIGALITNLFNPESWEKTTPIDKLTGYLKAEIQLYNALATMWVVRKRLFRVWSKKWNNRNEL